MSELLDAALRYLPRTIPLVPGHKRPLVADWPNWSATRGSVEALWRKHPEANVGIRTGNMLVVVDLDPRASGHERLGELEAEHGATPSTPTVLTGGADGGEHRYFRVPAGPIPSFTIALGLEIKADGRQVVAPPSIHPDTGRAYRWAGDRFDSRTIVPLPRWLLTLAVRSRTAAVGGEAAIERDDFLLSIPAVEYVPDLTDRPVDRRGYVQCPFHKDGNERTPSLFVGGPKPTLWKCFGCQRGGDIYVLAGLMFKLEPPLRGPVFLTVREQVEIFYERKFGITPGIGR